MKRKFVRPPFALPGFAKVEWERIQEELGGLRGRSEFMVWKAAAAAETQGRYRRGQLNKYDVTGLKTERRRLGLPDLPDY